MAMVCQLTESSTADSHFRERLAVKVGIYRLLIWTQGNIGNDNLAEIYLPVASRKIYGRGAFAMAIGVLVGLMGAKQ